MNQVKHNSYEKIDIGLSAITIIFGLAHLVMGTDAIEFQKVDSNKVPEELAMLAAVTKANYDNIKTLQGKMSFEDMVIYRGAYAADLVKQHAGIAVKEPNELVQRAEGTVEFKVDLRKNLLFKSMYWPKPTEFIDFDGNATYPSLSGAMEQTKTVADKYEIESYPYTQKKDGTVLTRVAHKRLRRQPGMIIDDSDPRIAFNIGRPVWELLTQFSDGLRSYNQGTISSFYDVVLEKAQTAQGVTYRTQWAKPGASQFFEKFILDGEKGFNPTYIEVKNDNGITVSEITTDFNKIDGIFLPSKRRVIQYDGTDGCLRRDATSTFSDMKVNVVLPENTFLLTNLGLKNGDKFINEIESKEYKYQDANLVFVSDLPAPTRGKQGSTVVEPNNPPHRQLIK
jgi:hypothetical protein